MSRVRGNRVVDYAKAGLKVALVLALVYAFPIMLLWNWLLPGLIGVRTVTFWEAAGLFLLPRLLLGTVGIGNVGQKQDPPRGESSRYWDEYDRWWKDEGQVAFDQYANRRPK